jgi:SpoVK/Ycf46/Vps4 family AAA+-type ATPase
MPKTRELADLFRAIASNDFMRANTLARALAGRHGSRGQHRAERDLLAALGDGSRSGTNGTGAPIQAWQINNSLMPLHAIKHLPELELTPAIRATLEELLQEWKASAELTRQEIPRRWRLLFHGPSGCGKSAAAAAMAAAAGLPAFLVRFDSLIGAYLGQTALRLREVFRFAEQNPCVLLFDEVDALAKRRGSPMEVGELDRIVIAFMQELEHAKSDGFIVATSNLPRSLDDALWRRFDLRLDFPKPNRADLARFASRLSRAFEFRASRKLIATCKRAMSYADAEQIVISEARRRVLNAIR